MYWKTLQATIGVSYIGRFNQYYDDPALNDENDFPQFVWSTELNSNLIYKIEKIGLDMGLFYKYTGKLPRYEIDSNGKVQLTRLGAYNWLDFNVDKTINRFLTIRAGVKNIFSVTDVESTSASTGSAHSTTGPVPVSYGRSYFAGIVFQYDRK